VKSNNSLVRAYLEGYILHMYMLAVSKLSCCNPRQADGARLADQKLQGSSINEESDTAQVFMQPIGQPHEQFRTLQLDSFTNVVLCVLTASRKEV